MKKLITIIYLFTFISVSKGQQDTLKITGIYMPSSYWKVYYADSVPKYIKGVLYTGVDTFDFEYSGEKRKAIETYKEGYKVILQTFYDNGNPDRYYEFRNGKRNGVSKGWYKSGKKIFDNVMLHGKEIGTSIDFFENGSPKYIENREFAIAFWENGKTKSYVKYLYDSVCGTGAYQETRYFQSGQLEVIRTENCGKQHFTLYYNDSTKKAEGTGTDMSIFKVSDYTEWYENGKKKLEGKYDDQKPNVKTGTWKYYTEKGLLQREEFYQNNELKKTNTYIPEKKTTKIKKEDM
ncbi:MAG: hypothetical protein ACXVPU_12270 [Bacteroidia bacterium]